MSRQIKLPFVAAAGTEKIFAQTDRVEVQFGKRPIPNSPMRPFCAVLQCGRAIISCSCALLLQPTRNGIRVRLSSSTRRPGRSSSMVKPYPASLQCRAVVLGKGAPGHDVVELSLNQQVFFRRSGPRRPGGTLLNCGVANRVGVQTGRNA